MSAVITHDTDPAACWWVLEGDIVTSRLGAVIAATATPGDVLWLRRLRPLGAASEDSSWSHRLVALRAALSARARRYGGDEPCLRTVRAVLADGLRGDYDAVDLAADRLRMAGLPATELLSLLDCYLSVLTALETAP